MAGRDTRRLAERFRPGDAVQVLLRTRQGEVWVDAVVAARQAPGLWVETRSGQRWFVTNGGRIRPAGAATDG